MSAGAERCPVLMYHRVDLPGSRFCVPPARFAAQLRALARAGFRAVTLEHFTAWLAGETRLEPGDFLLTFDDGYRDLHHHVLPVLRELDWPGVVFLVSDRIGGESRWATDDEARPVYPLLDAAMIATLRAHGVSFQSHSRTHPRLTALDATALADELAGSRVRLEALLDEPVEALAYPFGAVDERVAEAARDAGYRLAFSTRSGFNRRGEDRWRLRRIDVHGDDSPRMLLRKIRLGTNDGGLMPLVRYYLRRLLGKV
ncbi:MULTISPECIES: polysaccharide deacetylase family protein [unclassified Marichromatium]|uniref:polysaccharide deacetylase family protein n=1 Tax=unclassified Marichromatium TaxID=2618417 RepID=UPI001CC207BC|nr:MULTISPECIES: polysaccharide deacetylase family protein [unclassified Marichromatium]